MSTLGPAGSVLGAPGSTLGSLTETTPAPVTPAPMPDPPPPPSRPRIRVELNFGSGPYAPPVFVLETGRLDVNPLEVSASRWFILESPTHGQLDEEQLASDALGEGFWTNLADFTERVSIRSGRNRALESFNATHVSVVLDNSDRRFDPTNVDGPYVVGSHSAIVPMRPFRVVVEHNDTQYDLAYVYADRWDVTWQDPAVSTTTLTGTDAFKVFSDFDPLEVLPVGSGETSGARINRVLDNVGWPATARDIDPGNSALQATNLSANSLTELKATADSERGQFFVAPNGKVTFRQRDARILNPRSLNVQWYFNDDPTTSVTVSTFGQGNYGEGDYGEGVYGEGEFGEVGSVTVAGTSGDLGYADLVVSNDDELIRNRTQVARVGGTVQTAADPTSIARNLTHTFTRTDLLLTTDEEVADYGRTVLVQHKDAELRFDKLVLEPEGDQALWPAVLGMRFGDRISIARHPPGGGVLARECFVEGIDHDIPARGHWRTTVALSDASRTGGLILEHPTRGALDSSANYLSF